MISFKQYLLQEATFDIDDAVSYIYKNYYAYFFESLAKLDKTSTFVSERRIATLSSAKLAQVTKNKTIIKANDLNPIDIKIWMPGTSNAYNPGKRQVTININSNFVKYLKGLFLAWKQNDESFSTFEEYALIKGRRQYSTFNYDFTGIKLKNSIAHELTHWLDDTLHNNHIHLRLLKSRIGRTAKEQQDLLAGKSKNVQMTDFERQAQIHQIKTMKKNTQRILWDSLTFEDMISRESALDMIYAHLLNKNEKEKWKKMILKRMAREKLLGKKMKMKMKRR